MVTKKKTEAKPIVPMSIIRTHSAGVWYGHVESREGKEVVLSSARRVWRWDGANTLSEMALHGLDKTSKVAEPVNVTLTEAIEIIEATEEAGKKFDVCSWGR